MKKYTNLSIITQETYKFSKKTIEKYMKKYTRDTYKISKNLHATYKLFKNIMQIIKKYHTIIKKNINIRIQNI